MLPAFVVLKPKIDLHEGTPFRALRLANQVQPSFLRGMVGLARIAGNARADDVFPSGWAAAIPGNHVIQIQIFALKNLTAILAGVAIPLKNIVSRELDLFFGKPIKHDQQNNTGNPDFKADGADALGVRLLLGKILPLTKAESLEGTV